MFRFIVLLSLMGATLGQETFFKKYAFTKAMTTCFGQDVYYNYQKELANYARECQQHPVYLHGMTTNINIPIYATQHPGYYADVGGQSVYVPVQSYYPNYYGQVQYALPGAQRHARDLRNQPFFDRETLEGSISKVAAALSNFTCTLQKANAIDENLNLKIETIINNYYNTPIVNSLRDDLIQGLNYCKDLVTCLPLQKLKSPIPEPLQRVVMFSKCERKTRLGACVKHDIRRNLDLFDLSALPNVGGQAGDVEKLMTILIGVDSLKELELI